MQPAHDKLKMQILTVMEEEEAGGSLSSARRGKKHRPYGKNKAKRVGL
jgi:hypothetical protein